VVDEAARGPAEEHVGASPEQQAHAQPDGVDHGDRHRVARRPERAAQEDRRVKFHLCT